VDLACDVSAETADARLLLRPGPVRRLPQPVQPIGSAAVSARASRHLLRAGVQVPRPGSHTLRHTLVQRLVDFEFGLKEIGDFVGHRSPASTQIYSKVAVESLRQVALGDGKEVFNE
jgi:integrase/recombinase XerD